MRTSLLTILMLANLTWTFGQCAVMTDQSEDKKVCFQKTWGAKIKNYNNVIAINIVMVDTVDTKDKPTYYLTVAVDSLGNETINKIDQLTLEIENGEQIIVESKQVTLPEFVSIFGDNEKFFRIEITTFNQIVKNLLIEIKIKENQKQEMIFYPFDKKKFAYQARCIKNAW